MGLRISDHFIYRRVRHSINIIESTAQWLSFSSIKLPITYSIPTGAHPVSGMANKTG